ncbi:SET domain-containing protein-lysine N-methyltransferase [Streptomyces niger]|uniref:SET domain-containing protein-lysine N-methyltransferase n=1 Tax=Streptomyces niger TaxID=66373 RepID=UPI00069ADE79|nr:SET domain-containing methyltransferase [Streptomyces niger]
MKQGNHDELVTVRDAGDRGVGVFAARDFPAGSVVLVGVIEAELDRNTPHASQIGIDRFVLHAGLMPMANHSCDPNCGIRPNATGAHNLIARTSITEGEEITYDYAMRNYTIEHFPVPCQCGTARCRRRITGWKDLPNERKSAYRGLIAPYLLDLDKLTGRP